MSVTKITGTGLGLPTADGNALGGTSNEWSDFYLADGGVIDRDPRQALLDLDVGHWLASFRCFGR